MQGTIINHKLCCKRKVRVNPVEHHYEKPGQTPYVKYSCPVCEAIGNTHISIAKGTDQCPLCGVTLEWKRKPELHDLVTVNDHGYRTRPYGFRKDETLTIANVTVKENDIKVYLLKNENGNERLYLEEEFSILLDPDEQYESEDKIHDE